MPKDFQMCKEKGGRIRTKKLKGGKYMRICFLDGKSYAGEVKMMKKEGKTSKEAMMRAAEKEEMMMK